MAKKVKSTNNHLFLVDGSAYIFRAYHALPPLRRPSDGLPIGAVSGFCNMIWKLLVDAAAAPVSKRPTHGAVIFDYSSKTFRNDIYPEYKANRLEPPEDLRPQFGIIRQATRAFCLPCIEKEGFEADDLIASYIRQIRDDGWKVTIFSSDKDLMQLVDDQVLMYDAMKDNWIDESGVVAKFGVPPSKMIDLQALSGDSSDNIPGVPGIGPKTAAQLLDEFGTLENLLENAHTIKQSKRRENLIEFADQARLSKRLVTLDDSVKLDTPIDDLIMDSPDSVGLVSFLKGVGLNSLTRRVAKELECDADAIDPATIEVDYTARGPDLDASSESSVSVPESASDSSIFAVSQFVESEISRGSQTNIDTKSYETVRTMAQLEEWIACAYSQGVVALDTESTSLDAMQAELVGISLAIFTDTSTIRACYIPLAHVEGEGDLLGEEKVSDQLDLEKVLKSLKPLLESGSVLKVAQNMKYDYLLLSRYDVLVAPFDDTMLLSYVLDAGRGKHNMTALCERWLGHTPISFKDTVSGFGDSFAQVPIDTATLYAAEDADVTLRLWKILKARLSHEGLNSVYERLERPLVEVLCRMEHTGICVDKEILESLSDDFGKQASGIEKEIYELAGEEFNIGSPKQLGVILFGKLGLPGGKKTKTGQYATGVQVLEDLALQGHVLPSKIVDWRQLMKLKSTYTDALPDFIHPDTHRVHTSYAMASTSTGRLSSSDPNLQNIPIRTNEGRKIRTAFIAPSGFQLLSADYSQIELRLLAHIADIQQLKQAFSDGIDIHAMTASEMFGAPIDGMDPTIRRQAKAINFGIIYGISAFGLAANLGISRSEAAEYIELYFRRFSGIKDYMESTKTFAREHGFVETIFGRRAYYPELQSTSGGSAQMRAFSERAAINAPIQGSAADLLRRAMIRMESAISDAGLTAKMLLQVHDELIFEVSNDEVESTTSVVRSIMEDAAMPALSLSVPLQVDIQAADNWEAAH